MPRWERLFGSSGIRMGHLRQMFSAAEDLRRAPGLTLIEVGVFEAKEFGDAFKTMRREHLEALLRRPEQLHVDRPFEGAEVSNQEQSTDVFWTPNSGSEVGSTRNEKVLVGKVANVFTGRSTTERRYRKTPEVRSYIRSAAWPWPRGHDREWQSVSVALACQRSTRLVGQQQARAGGGFLARAR
jgi:hypothetical protein